MRNQTLKLKNLTQVSLSFFFSLRAFFIKFFLPWNETRNNFFMHRGQLRVKYITHYDISLNIKKHQVQSLIPLQTIVCACVCVYVCFIFRLLFSQINNSSQSTMYKMLSHNIACHAIISALSFCFHLFLPSQLIVRDCAVKSKNLIGLRDDCCVASSLPLSLSKLLTLLFSYISPSTADVPWSATKLICGLNFWSCKVSCAATAPIFMRIKKLHKIYVLLSFKHVSSFKITITHTAVSKRLSWLKVILFL